MRRSSARIINNASRDKVLERRKSLSRRGKTADTGGDRTRVATDVKKSKVAKAVSAAVSNDSAPAEAPKKDCGCGCGGKNLDAKTGTCTTASRKARIKSGRKTVKAANPSRAAVLARRKALSTHGKTAIKSSGASAAQTARATNPDMTSRDLARSVREERCTKGKCGPKASASSAPVGKLRQRPAANAGASNDAPWKVGASETATGQTVTGTMTGRSEKTTGDEASTCRSITGTDYMGADVFRDFCGAEPSSAPAKVRSTQTSRGNGVTGNEVGRSSKVTGDEQGTCKNVTGTEYVSAEQSNAFCGTAPAKAPRKVTTSETSKGMSVSGVQVAGNAKVTGSESGSERALTGTGYAKPAEKAARAPAKVGVSNTLNGGGVTGTMVGNREKMTGDEAGACRNVTGDQYLGADNFQQFCDSKPQPTDAKVGVSNTLLGESVTGTMTGRVERVTGNEPGTCKAVTGTPYAGDEQYASFCAPEQQQEAAARMTVGARLGKPLTGQQPGIGGSLTGADKGACEPLTGTPYVGADQVAAACPAIAAEPNSPDFPQLIGANGAAETPWGDFSVEAPNHASDTLAGNSPSRVTGYAQTENPITGPFGMASGKVTGTEEARFSTAAAPLPVVDDAPAEIDGRLVGRITGEGMNAGPRITGDDWDRNERVTGTEGPSSLGRNPTRRGPVNAMPSAVQAGRPEETPMPVSKVTGSAGSTANGSLITFSGGARG